MRDEMWWKKRLKSGNSNYIITLLTGQITSQIYISFGLEYISHINKFVAQSPLDFEVHIHLLLTDFQNMLTQEKVLSPHGFCVGAAAFLRHHFQVGTHWEQRYGT